MKHRSTFVPLLALGLLLALAMGLALAQDQAPQVAAGTAFTYQGRLDKDGSPVTAGCELSFRLYDSAEDGALAGSPITLTVPITDGLFSAVLDFGPGVFGGDARWLGIRVRCPDDATFADLGRQALTATPYAAFALAAHWSGLDGVPPGFADGIDDVAVVISGTTTIAGDGLNQAASGDTITLSVAYSGSGSAATAARSDHDHGGAYWSLVGNGGTSPAGQFLGTTDAQPLVLKTGGREAVRIDALGSVGVGTASPRASLDVSGTLYASGSVTITGPVRLSDTLDMAGGPVANVAAPAAASDAANKAYVDAARQAAEDSAEDRRLDEVSNGLVSNEYQVSWDISSARALPDVGTEVVLLEPRSDGTALDLGVRATVAHPHPETLRILLKVYPPGGATPSSELTLFQGSQYDVYPCPTLENPATCDGSGTDPNCQRRSFRWPDVDQPASGSLDGFVGANPSGDWSLWIIDSCETYPGASAEGSQYLTEYGLDYRLWSSAEVTVDGSLTISGSLGIGTSSPASALQVSGGYIQFDTITGAAPPASDCDSPSEAGRTVVRSDGPPDLYICDGAAWIGK